MKYVKVKNKNNEIIFKTTANDEYIQNHIPLIEPNFGKPERWVLELSEPYEADDVLQTEQRTFTYTAQELNELGHTVEVQKERNETWVKLKAEYTIHIEDYDPVPQTLNATRIRIALSELGWRDKVEAVIKTSVLYSDLWDYSSSYDRSNKILISIAHGIGMKDADIDKLFKHGAELQL